MAEIDAPTIVCLLGESNGESLIEALEWLASEGALDPTRATAHASLNQKLERNSENPRLTVSEMDVAEHAALFAWGLARGAHEDDKKMEAENVLEVIRASRNTVAKNT